VLAGHDGEQDHLVQEVGQGAVNIEKCWQARKDEGLLLIPPSTWTKTHPAINQEGILFT
jgi:hypothetical protein